MPTRPDRRPLPRRAEVGRGGMEQGLAVPRRAAGPRRRRQTGRRPARRSRSMDLARALREARHSAVLNHPQCRLDLRRDRGGQRHLAGDGATSPGAPSAELIPEPTGRCRPNAPPASAARWRTGSLPRTRAARVASRREAGQDPGDRGRRWPRSPTSGSREPSGRREDLTRSGLVMRTSAYFSAEQARGEEPTPAADVWAFGRPRARRRRGNGPSTRSSPTRSRCCGSSPRRHLLCAGARRLATALR